MAKVAIIGIGNVLTGDDAVGPHVVRVLEARYDLPETVQVIDAGTPGYDLTAFLVGLDAALLVDAVKAKGAPGELRVYDRAELVSKRPILAMSPHEPGVREALLNADFMGVTPPVVRLVGVIPAATESGIGLSPAVRDAIPLAVERVADELRALGVEVRLRAPPREPDLWWERKPQA
ncbi:MAG TPA: hydrogenase maturation protease [Anaeromyxobacter sp.]|nr:hydrogenase maturation protease [Anaeromyxobacter sp.]